MDDTPQPTPHSTLPKKRQKVIYTNCLRVYEAMELEAVEIGDNLIYIGFTTKLFKNLGLSVPYYSMIRKELLRMGSVSIIKRGGGTSPSEWALLKKPDVTLYETSGRNLLTEATPVARLEQRIQNLSERMTAVELYLFPEEREKNG